MLYLNFEPDVNVRFASSGQFVSLRNTPHPRRRLDHYVLLLGTAGQCPIARDGGEYLLTAGTFLLLLANREHWGTAPVTDRQTHFWCHFYLSGESVTDDVSRVPPRFCTVPEFGRLKEPQKLGILWRQLIDAEYGQYADPAVRQAVCDAYVSILLHEIANEYASTKAVGVPSTEEGDAANKRKLLVSSVKEWIKLGLDGPLSPADVALHFGYSADYLTSLFRKETGSTLCAYIGRARVEKSKKYLLGTDMKIAQIASASGFADEKYFLRLFRRFEGVTPSEYRQAYFNLHLNHE
ncbi:MAG: helix-turn-helix transcriptional regulator [Clostridia bacterium]|nr:helix-turn-helix transcriptional regulator [Clostridia bacterium]